MFSDTKKKHKLFRYATFAALAGLVLLTSCNPSPEEGTENGPKIALYFLPSFLELENLLLNQIIGGNPQNVHRGSGDARHADSSSAVSGNGFGLLRQPDCSLTEYFLNASLTPSGSSFQVLSTIPNFQDQLHKNQGLTTTPDKWPNGCSVIPGASASQAAYLGAIQGGSRYLAAALNQVAPGLFVATINPAGGAIPTTALTGAPDPSSLATVDLNGDGYNDLIVADTPYAAVGDPGGIFVFLSNGDGTFKPAVHYAVPFIPQAMTVLDVSGDGKADVVVASGGNGSGSTTENLVTLLGNGDGTFRSALASPGTGGAYVASADLNGDGKPDLVFDNGAIQFGNGDGTFQAATVTLPGLAGGGMPAIADYNNDGKNDVAVFDPSGPFIHVYTGNGDGTFATGPVYPSIYGTLNLGAADIDGDGNMDLIAGLNAQGAFTPEVNSNEIMQIMLGYGNGTFLNGLAFPNTTTANFAVGDFNGDGKPDLLGTALTYPGQSNGLQLLAGNGKGNFTPQTPTGLGNPTWIAAADMNKDSKLDAVFADSGAAVGVSLGNGKGGFGAVTDYALPSGGGIVAMATGDFNGDGAPDVLVLASGGSPNAIYLYLNEGNGTLKDPQLIDTPVSPYGVAIGDLNGDGKLDFVITNSGFVGNNSNNTPGSMEVYLGKGDGTFSSPVSYTPGYGVGYVAIADMNNDGKPDILVNSVSEDYSTGTLSVYLGNGDGTFQPEQNTQLPDAAITNIAVADFNHDGKPDALIGDCCGLAYTSIAFGKGDGTFLAVESSPLMLSSFWVTAADVNGDGLPDMLLASTRPSVETANIEVFLNTSGQSANLAPTTTTLTASASTVSAGTSVTFTATVSPTTGTGVPTGTVTFMDGTTTLGTSTLSASGVATYSTSSLAAGSNSITAVYGGSSTYGSSTSSAVVVMVSGGTSTLAPTSTTLTASASSAVSGTSLTFTATVAETSGTATPTGTVTFMDGTTVLGTGTLASGKATYSTSSLAVGTQSITASYGGDSSNAASTSSAVSVVITAASTGDFSIALSPNSGSITQGGKATTTVNIAPSGGFSQQVSFACSGLPKYASCSFSPSTITPSGTSTATSTLTIKTDVPTVALLQPSFTGRGGGRSGGTLSLAFIFGAGLFGSSLFRIRRKSGWIGTFLSLAVAMILTIFAITGCGSSLVHKTSVGTYQVTITASAGNDSHTASYVLTVSK